MIGLAIAAAVTLIAEAGQMSANDTQKEAENLMIEARSLYNNEKSMLEDAQQATERSLLSLGDNKKRVLEGSMKSFLNSYEKVRKFKFKNSTGLNEIDKFKLDDTDIVDLQNMTDIYSETFTTGETGVAEGTVVALAAAGPLLTVTGGLATVGSKLMAGQIGMAAAGIATPALSLAASITPLSAIAAPVVLFTSISSGIQADDNLDKAKASYAEVEAAVEKMKTSKVLCEAITERSNMLNRLLYELSPIFTGYVKEFIRVVDKRESEISGRKLVQKDFSDDEITLIAVTRSLAGAVKSVIDTPIINSKGKVSSESKEVYNNVNKALPDFKQNLNIKDYSDSEQAKEKENSKKSAPSKIKCPVCGETLNGKAKFCNYCGTKIS